MASYEIENTSGECIRASAYRVFFVRGARVALLFCIGALLLTGCTKDEERREAIKEAVEKGRFDQAERMARDNFADDKLEMLVLLEYIRGQKERAAKAAYRGALSIGGWSWVKDRGGNVVVRGEVLNSGKKRLTGFAVKIEYMKGGRVVAQEKFRKIEEIGPGETGRFEFSKGGASDCDQVTIALFDVGLNGE